MNALKCLLRAEKNAVKKEIEKIVHDLWIEKGMRQIEPNKNDQV